MAGFLVPALLTLVSVGAQVQADKRQKKASDIEQRRADAQAASERRRIVREERIRRAQVINLSAQTGTQGSSSEAGALGSLSSQTSAAIGQSLGAQQLSRQASSALQSAQNFSTASSIFGSAANFSRQYK